MAAKCGHRPGLASVGSESGSRTRKQKGARISRCAPLFSAHFSALIRPLLLLLLAAAHRYEADEARSEKSHRAWLWCRNETLSRRVPVVVVPRDHPSPHAWREVRARTRR